MPNWTISVPVWGDAYVRMFQRAAAPALLVAARRLRRRCRFIVHTDQPDAVRAALPGQDVETRAIGSKPTYVTLQESHADALASAEVGERVILLNADLVVSGNLLLRCAQHMASGVQAVVLMGIRTAASDELPPVGAAPRDLLRWAWDHRHRIIRDLEWPAGGSMLPTNLFWEGERSVVARGFHLHPVAVVRQESTSFRSTIDGDLLDGFPRRAVHVVTSPDDCAMLEVSPPDRRFPVRGRHFTPAQVAASMQSRASETHRWLFTRRIVVCGDGSDVTEDTQVAADILGHMRSSHFHGRGQGSPPLPQRARGGRGEGAAAVRSRHRGPGGRRGAGPAAGRWVVALPAWGDRCVGVLLRHTLPSLVAALGPLARRAEMRVYTDQPERVIAALPAGVDRSLPGVPGPDNSFESMSNCHREALRCAGPTDRVLLLTSDMVLSREILATCEAKVAGGKQIVCCVPPRTLEDADPPAGATGPELMRWAWANRHPMTRECTWPDGHSYDVWRMYFEQDGEVAARVFLPHPLVVVPAGRRVDFSPTVDVNMTANFSSSATHLITRPEEGAAVELSPADKEFVMTRTMRDRMDEPLPSCPPFTHCSNRRHRMFWEKRVVILGSGGDCGDGEVAGRILG